MFKKIIQYSLLSFSLMAFSSAKEITENDINTTVKSNIEALVQAQSIPGMAVAVIYKGQPYYFSFGVADIQNNLPVTPQTIFEIGSISKTFTAILGADSIARGKIHLEDSASLYWPSLTNDQWKNINLLELATYSAGGLPLQIPENITDESSLAEYYNNWQPEWAPSTKRLYSNASLGLFGVLVGKALNTSFENTMMTHLIQPLNLTNTWLNVPESEMNNYAWGYSNDKAVRVSPAVLAEETYGIKTSVVDLAKWLQVNMNPDLIDSETLQSAVDISLHRYYKMGDMYQGLGWEMYDFPLNEALIISNSDNKNALAPHDVTKIMPPQKNSALSWIHKTGATNGFGAYVAFVPEKSFGIVILANKNYPNVERTKVALKIFNELEQ